MGPKAAWRRWLSAPFGLTLVILAASAAALGLVIAVSYAFQVAQAPSDETFLLTQDLPALPLCALCLIAAGAVAWAGFGRLTSLVRTRPTLSVLAMAVFTLSAGLLAARLVFGGYDFSLDEFMADFDAKIFVQGRLMAPIAAPWRPIAEAMQPLYATFTPHNEFWASAYLPVNAAVRAFALKLGAEAWVNPLWSALSVAMVYAVARRLWPQRPGLALGAAALLATSSQLLITAATAYAMPAHLALNLVWLWCFLRGGRFGHIAALVIGFLACGLHQLIFHPLFAAPFVLQLWLDRRWEPAVSYTLAYVGFALFWSFYPSLVFHLVGAAPDAARAVGGQLFLKRVTGFFKALSDNAPGALAEALMRFVTWQNPLTVPLALAAAIPAIRAKGETRALAIGIVMTLAAVAVTVPSPTHGWGYRYLHGLLGSFCLLAVFGWARLTDRLGAPARRRAEAGFALACAVSLLVLTPLRAWQAWSYVKPYADANALIQAAPEPVVLIDNQEPWFDLGTVTRNDPFLAHGPKVVLLPFLNAEAVQALCAQGPVGFFDGGQADDLGMDTFDAPKFRRLPRLRAVMAQMKCGTPLE